MASFGVTWPAGILTLCLALTIACAPPFFPSQAPHDNEEGPVPALPLPNIDATVEAIVTQRVEEALAAIPTVTPVPTATPIPTQHPRPFFRHCPFPIPAQSRIFPRLAPRRPPWIPRRTRLRPAHPPAAPDLALMIDRVKPGVVRINAQDSNNRGVGSGIIIEALEGKKGLVLTNYHVVGDSFRIDVLVGDSRTFRGRLCGI